MALPWTLFLVLLGFYAEGAHAWCPLEDELYIDEPVSDPDIVKFALSAFHKQSKDEYAYRSIHVMHFSKVQGKLPETFLMKLRLRRTICKTSEDRLDTCPFQDSPELKNIFICSFTISSPRSKQFNMVKMTCS
ncbi:putative cystatin-9-like protein CST9LP1 [Acomys russatus]|uniref:putative cystatin-9-like protein CST9LP1 n=1 Tax=Acomys russatus TaxID=60746 RepID=UPI0021E2E48A|nr:putative cystatin-9-like protein CST9LP1 [Acomys russatus]